MLLESTESHKAVRYSTPTKSSDSFLEGVSNEPVHTWYSRNANNTY